MLSTQAEPKRASTATTTESSAPRFDNILGSIRNLAQEINLDEITAADENVNQLVEKLLSLEKQILTLSEIRRRLSAASGNQPDQEKERLLNSGCKLPKLIPFPGIVKSSTPAPVETESTDKKPVVDMALRATAGETRLTFEKPSPVAKPTIVSSSQNSAPLRPQEMPGEEKKRPSLPVESLISFPLKTKDTTHGKAMVKDFPVWEKDPTNAETQEIAVLEPTMPAPAHPRINRESRQRPFMGASNSKEKGKYQVTYSFVDKRTNFDQRLRELVKTYGEVDIYSGTDAYNKKRNVKKAAVVAFVLVLAFSVFPGGASWIGNLQQPQFNRPDSSPVSEPFTPRISSSLAAGTLPTATLPIAETEELSVEPKPAAPTKPRKLTRKAENVESFPKTPFADPSKIEEMKKQEISQTSVTNPPQSIVTNTQTAPVGTQQ